MNFWLLTASARESAIKLDEFREGCLLVNCFKSVINHSVLICPLGKGFGHRNCVGMATQTGEKG